MNTTEENKKVLNEIHKGLVMGMESLSVIEPKISSDEFRRLINSQYNEYADILLNVNSNLEEYNVKGEDTSPMQKVMGWSSIQMSTLMDDSDSKISDMLIRMVLFFFCIIRIICVLIFMTFIFKNQYAVVITGFLSNFLFNFANSFSLK